MALVATPFAAESQQGGKVYRIGTLTRGGREAAAPYNRALEEGLEGLGWVEGRNVIFEHRYADLKPERYPVLAAELVRLGVDIVVTPSTPAGLAVRRATATIPIVTIVAVDPVGAGLVTSLARPGGNVTGLTNDTGPELGAKIARVREFAEAGGRMAYSTDLVDLYRRAAIHIDKILKGTKPGDLPIEQPTKFELAVNLRTAKALGLSIPPSLLARTDRVVEQ